MKHKTYTVYALIDPNTMSIVYIGVTSLDVNYRLYNHLEEAFMFQRQSTWSFNEKHFWLLTLYSRNQLPFIVKLAVNFKSKRQAYKSENDLINLVKNLPNSSLINGRNKAKVERPNIVNKGLSRVFKKNGITIKFF